MTKILIKNMPPVNDVDVELKNLNVLIGFDKRCISVFKKIIEYCIDIDNQIIRSSRQSCKQMISYTEAAKDILELLFGLFSNMESKIEWISDVTFISFSENKISIKIKHVDESKIRGLIKVSDNNINPQENKNDAYLAVNEISDKEITILDTNNPFFLYRINSCIIHSIVKSEMPEHERTTLQCRDAVLDPKDVLIMQAKNGCITCVQHADGTIGDNCLDDEIKDMMKDTHIMLKYYKDHE